jgi:hypothetical protein
MRNVDYGYDDDDDGDDYADNDDDEYSSDDNINLSYLTEPFSSVMIITDSNANRRVNKNIATSQHPSGNA